jgi:tetratricopeptide (TPR) repeat protein
LRLLADALGLADRERAGLDAAYNGLEVHDLALGIGPEERPAQLPADVASFTGRSDEIARLDAAFAEAGERPTAATLVNVSGTAGVGKTALAVHWAHRVAGRFPDGQLYMSLAGFDLSAANPAEPGRVLARFLRALGADAGTIPDDVAERSELYRSLLADRRILIVLDDAATERQVRPLLPGGPSCKVLITSRLRLPALEGVQIIDLEVFDTGQALELFAEVAGPERVTAEQAAADRIVHLCGRLPLAVQIAAARLAARPHWTVGMLAERLSDEHRRLDELAIGDLEVRGSVAFSYKQLDEPQRVLFRRLGLLPGPEFPGWVAMPLLDGSAGTVEGVVESLVDARLVDVAGVDASGFVRYRLHDLVRIFAEECARAEELPEELQASQARMHGAWLFLAEQADARLEVGQQLIRIGSSGAPRWAPDEQTVERLVGDPLAWLETERPVLVQAVLQACELGLHENAWDLACCLSRFLEIGWHIDDWQVTHEAALAAARSAGNPRGEANILRAMGEMHMDRDRYEEALTCLGAAMKIFDDLGDGLPSAHVRRAIGVACRILGRIHDAVQHLEKTIPIFREADDAAGLAGALHGLGSVQRESGRHLAALESYQEGLTLFRRLDDSVNVALVLCSTGVVLHAMGRLSDAEACLKESLALSLNAGHKFSELYARAYLGELYTDTGEWRMARDHLNMALLISQQISDRFGQALSLRNIGELHRKEGDFPEARRLLTEAVVLFREARLPLWEARALRGLGDVAKVTGNDGAAREFWCAAYELFVKLGTPEAGSLAPLLRSAMPGRISSGGAGSAGES